MRHPGGRRCCMRAQLFIHYRRLVAGVVLCASAVCAIAPATSGAGNWALGPTTLRSCGNRTSYADPINVVFIGTHATWRNSQRLVGQERSNHSALKWRTVSFLAGGSQSITDSSHPDGCFAMPTPEVFPSTSFLEAQSSTGGIHKHHTRYFQQTRPLSAGNPPFLITAQDAHRDIKTSRCKGPGSIDVPPSDIFDWLPSYYAFNDRVPVKVDGATDGGYNKAQREFLKAFSDRKLHTVWTSSAKGRQFMQCPEDTPPRRYMVGWNGKTFGFQLSQTIACQTNALGLGWHSGPARVFGHCPSGN